MWNGMSELDQNKFAFDLVSGVSVLVGRAELQCPDFNYSMSLGVFWQTSKLHCR
jgi:hypothetical protein